MNGWNSTALKPILYTAEPELKYSISVPVEQEFLHLALFQENRNYLKNQNSGRNQNCSVLGQNITFIILILNLILNFQHEIRHVL